ncbi:hypothetical protein ACFQ0T_26325 [Kitasatospora gansuensis]
MLHPPSALSLVVVGTAEEQTADWSWSFWLPQLQPTHGQACRLLVGFGPEQTEARLTELANGPSDGLSGPPATVLLLDGTPGTPEGRAALAVLLEQGPALGVFPICLAEQSTALPEGLGATAVLTGEVATQLTLDRPLGGGGRERIEEIAVDAVSPPGPSASPGPSPRSARPPRWPAARCPTSSGCSTCSASTPSPPPSSRPAGPPCPRAPAPPPPC